MAVPPPDRRCGVWAGILCPTLCALLLVAGPGAEASTPGSQLWVRSYNGLANREDKAYSVQVSPDGSKVFVAGWSTGTTSGLDYATLAYSATTGAQLWESRYDGPGNGADQLTSVDGRADAAQVVAAGLTGGP